MILHTDKIGSSSHGECAYAASWISLMYSPISKESRDSNRSGRISLKWFIWFLSMAHDNFLGGCRGPRAQLIIKASCSGQFCHSITSSVNKWHTWVTECQRESWSPDVLVDNFRWPWQANIGGMIQHPFFYETPPLSGCLCCPRPLLFTSSMVCTLAPLLLDSHTLLFWPSMLRPPPPPPQPATFLSEHSLCLRRQASEECVVIAQALNTQMFPLWFGLYWVGIMH